MSEESNEKPQGKARESCIFRVFTPLCIAASGQWIQGTQARPVIADLSDVEDAMILWLLERNAIETATGEPVNRAIGKVARKPCPCREKKR